MKEAVDAEAILDTAAGLIELDGVDAFTMRGLAEELGVAVTSIYWHVGGRDKLFDSLVDRLLSQMAHLPAEGDTPVDRIASLARSQRTALIERQHLLAIAHERDRTPQLFLPIQQTLAAQLADIGCDRNRCGARPARDTGPRDLVCGDAVLGRPRRQARRRGSLAVDRRLARPGAGRGAAVADRLRRRFRIRAQRASCAAAESPRRRVAPHSPTPMPTTAPPSPMICWDFFISR